MPMLWKKKTTLKKLIEDLYTIDFYITDDKLREILSYKEEAIPYLVDILNDTIENFDYYATEAGGMDFSGEYFEWFLAYHALLLLAELEADDAFPMVLRFHLQGEEFLDFWLWDIWPSYGSYALAKLGKNYLQQLMAVLDDPEQDILTRRMISAAFSRMVPMYPKKREQILTYYRKILHSDHDLDLMTSVVIDILDCYGKELESDIHAAYEKGRVDESMFPRDEVEFMPKDAVDPGWDIFTVYADLRKSYRFDSPHSKDCRKYSV
jgi:hypothetical protein